MEKTEKVYADGIRTFNKHEKAPDFVLGTLIISPNVLMKWINENPQYLTDYKGEPQLKMQVLNGDKGMYTTVDTWKPTEDKAPY